MASAMAAVTLSMASPSLTQNKKALLGSSSDAFFNPMRPSMKAGRAQMPSSRGRVEVRASSSPSLKKQAVAGLTAAALAAALVIPDVAEAAQPGLSPSLKNFLLSIVAGGVVLGVIGGAVIAVSNFDPVKRS